MTPITESTSARSSDESERFEAFLVGYALTYRFASDPRYYFKVFPASPIHGCEWIFPNLPEGKAADQAITFLLDAVRSERRVELHITPKIGEHLGGPLCRVVELSTLTS